MKQVLTVAIFLLISNSNIVCQPIGLGSIGNPIGLTAWTAKSWQLHKSNLHVNDGGNEIINRFGINIKYGSWGLFSMEPSSVEYLDTTIVEYTIKKVSDNDTIIPIRITINKKERTRYFARVSYGIGYQSLIGLRSPNDNLSMSFNLSGPYSGFYFSIPLFDVTKQSSNLNKSYKDIVDNHFDCASLIIAYNATLLGADGLSSSYTSMDSAGIKTSYALNSKLSSTVMHDLDIGIGLQVSKQSWFFIEGGYSYLRFVNASHSPAFDSVKISEIYNQIPKQLDFSSWVLKIGFSGNF